MVEAAQSDAFMKLAKEKGFTVEPMVGDDFDALLAAEDDKIVGIMEEAGLYQSKANRTAATGDEGGQDEARPHAARSRRFVR